MHGAAHKKRSSMKLTTVFQHVRFGIGPGYINLYDLFWNDTNTHTHTDLMRQASPCPTPDHVGTEGAP